MDLEHGGAGILAAIVSARLTTTNMIVAVVRLMYAIRGSATILARDAFGLIERSDHTILISFYF